MVVGFSVRMLKVTGPCQKLATEPAIFRVANSLERSLKMTPFGFNKEKGTVQCQNFRNFRHSLMSFSLGKREFCDFFDLKAIFNYDYDKNYFIYRS